MKRDLLLASVDVTFDVCKKLITAKNKDYSKEDDALSNFRKSESFGIKASQGIMVRLSDKMARIENLLVKDTSVEDENIVDTIHDAINYLALLKECLLEEKENGR